MSEEWSSEHVTAYLRQASSGDMQARNEAFRLLERHLRRTAEFKLRGEGPGLTLQATCLVDDAFLKLINNPNVCWNDRRQFLTYAAEVMRQILVDHARGRRTQKRGMGVRPERLSAETAEPAQDGIRPDVIFENHEKLLAVDQALSVLKERHPDLAEVVVLNYYGGYSFNQIGEEVLEIPVSTVKSRFAQAKVLLFRLLSEHS